MEIFWPDIIQSKVFYLKKTALNMDQVSILAITKNGIMIAREIKVNFPDFSIFAPKKFSDLKNDIVWYDESTSEKILELFKNSDAIICLFSLGAVIRLISPYIKDKKTDPAVIVIDDKKNFVISALSGHIGGANELTERISKRIGAISVVTTAADVNKTIAVDMIGKDFGWIIDDESTVTRVSALMVNEEKIGVFQDCGERNWLNVELPKNTVIFNDFNDMINSDCCGFLIITDRKIEGKFLKNSVIYRPKTLVVGIGLHWDTSADTIRKGLEFSMNKFGLSMKSINKLTTIKKPQEVIGLVEFGKEMKLPIKYFERDELSKIIIPNPSNTVKNFEGTASVSEASAILGSNGKLVVEKQKFPPDLTVAVARIEF